MEGENKGILSPFKPAKPTTNTAPVQVAKQNVVKKALLIGINYIGTSAELNGCINDSENLKKFLIQNLYIDAANITMMNDKLTGTLRPIRQNILFQFTNLVTFANQNPGKIVEIFLAYSGHGIGVKDTTGDELDGQDEALVPLDYQSAGFILDDFIRANLVDKLPANAKLVFLCDSCHSGTIMDLKYLYEVTAAKPETINAKLADTKCDVVTISGCKDNQTSADAYVANTYQGAMTAAFLANYKDEMTYKDLITKMRNWLISNRNRFTQIPQLCSGKKIDINTPFLLSIYNN
jgi:hypothetical protein